MNYTILYVRDHVEVYTAGGEFLFSADTYHDAMTELREMDAA